MLSSSPLNLQLVDLYEQQVVLLEAVPWVRPFFLEFSVFFCCYVTNFKGYFLFGCLFGCGSNLRRGSFITFILRGVHAWCAWAVLRGSSWLASQVKNSGFGHMLAARLLSPL